RDSPDTMTAHSATRSVSKQESRWSAAPPKNRLIRLGHSIAGISLDEPRRTVEKAFGPGKSTSRGVVSYFGGRLVVDYWWHDGLTTRVEALWTTWGGFHSRSGLHVGTSLQDLRALHWPCSEGTYTRAAGLRPGSCQRWRNPGVAPGYARAEHFRHPWHV